MRMWADVHVEIKLPVGDHESERMLGTRDDARAASENNTGFKGLNAVGRKSFLMGRVIGLDML